MGYNHVINELHGIYRYQTLHVSVLSVWIGAYTILPLTLMTFWIVY